MEKDFDDDHEKRKVTKINHDEKENR